MHYRLSRGSVLEGCSVKLYLRSYVTTRRYLAALALLTSVLTALRDNIKDASRRMMAAVWTAQDRSVLCDRMM